MAKITHIALTLSQTEAAKSLFEFYRALAIALGYDWDITTINPTKIKVANNLFETIRQAQIDEKRELYDLNPVKFNTSFNMMWVDSGPGVDEKLLDYMVIVSEGAFTENGQESALPNAIKTVKTTWKDIVEINGMVFGAEYEIDPLHEDGTYHCERFYDALEKKYGVEYEEIKTLAFDDIDVTQEQLQRIGYGLGECGGNEYEV